MAASTKVSVWDSPKVYEHHEQKSVCHTRAKYRDGRRPKAVKVYTINLESRYLLVQGVPAIGVMTELVQLLALYGAIEEYRVLDEYPAEEFTEVYLFKFQKLTSARAAKRKTDEKSFYGGLLHVCYAPEYETVDDTRHKLQDRRRYVNRVVQNKEKECESTCEESRPLTTLRNSTHSQDTCEEVDQLNVHVPENVPDKSSNYRDNSQGFPLLPFPPQERLFCHLPYSSHLQQGLPTEDKMGSLGQYAVPRKDHESATGQQDREASKTNRPNHITSSRVRFLPRPTNLDNRKRKAEETKSQSLMCTSDEGGPLIGPQLPEIPKTDLQDASLNVTAQRIRSTMAKIASVPESKPPEKKMVTPKPRRRI